MASLRTPASVKEGQSIMKVFKITSCVTSDTLKVPVNTKAVFAVNETTTDAISASLSAGVVTVVVANTPDVAVWCLL